MVRKYSPSDDVNYTIGRKIKEIRTVAGLSREAIAKKIGITHQQFQKYEQGVNKISASRLFLLARALNTSVEWFFEEADITDVNERAVASVFRNLTKCTVEQQAIINDVIKSVLKRLNQEENKENNIAV